MNVLFVCTGNTCRSPLAEAFLRRRAQEEALPLAVQSAGLFASAPFPASASSRNAAAAYGLTLETHVSQPVTEALLRWADAVYAMTSGHLARLQAQFPAHWEKMTVLTEQEIGDPFGCGQDVYDRCACDIREAVYALPLSGLKAGGA